MNFDPPSPASIVLAIFCLEKKFLLANILQIITANNKKQNRVNKG